jgi:signal transduction histidine kinase
VTDLHKSFRDSLDIDPERSTFRQKYIAVELPRWWVIVGSYLLLILLAFIDKITGTEVHIGIAYIAPVLAMAWYAGRTQSYFIAVASGAALLYLELHGEYTYQHVWIAYLNAAFRIVCYCIAAVLLVRMRDLSTRLETLVEQRTKAVRLLASQLSEAEDSERRRLANDIHDGFSQMLTLLKLNLAGAQLQNPEAAPSIENSSQQRQRLSDAIAIVDDLIQRSRNLTFDLHPAMLEHLGLAPTLRRYAEQFGRHTGIEVTINEEGHARPIPSAWANYLFRSAKELIHNAAKHGAAKQVVASIYWSATKLRIVIDDDGKGFQPAEVFAPNATKGLGLAGIHERVLSLGGTLQLESSDGKGTRVVLEIPIIPQETAA